MSGTVKDDVRAKVEARMKELEPLVAEYEELQRIVAAIDGDVGVQARSASRAAPRRALRSAGPGRQGHSARAEQAQELIEAQPGISVNELSTKMGIGTTYLYRLLPRLEREGKLRKAGRGYHPA
jgi:hypothetical protein